MADATLNTDFAQVEDDEQQVNLTRFSLFFPERREFFLEGAGIFAFGGASVSPRGGGSGPPSNTPILFYSRKIGLFEYGDDETAAVPLLAGGRLTGRTGAYTVGALNIQQRAEAVVGAPSTNFSVVRAQARHPEAEQRGRHLHEPVAVGERGRVEPDPGRRRLVHVPPQPHDQHVPRAHADRGDGTATTPATAATSQWMGDRYGFEAEHLTVERNFNPEVGFLRREDFRRNFGMFRFSPRPAGPVGRSGSTSSRRASITSPTPTAGSRRSWRRRRPAMDLQNGDEWRVEFKNNYEYLDEPFEIAEGLFLPVGAYRFNDVEARYTIGPQRKVNGTVWAGGGQFFDGTRTEVGYRGRIEVTSRLGVEPGIAFNWVDLAEGSFVAKLLTARVTYNLSPRKALMALVQYNSAGDLIGANVRFRWEFRPGSDLFVVYNEGRDTTLGVNRAELSSRSFVVKVTRLFRF